MVFRQDNEKRICAYTKDIGDICIFMGHNEPFCLFASDDPSLKPNSVAINLLEKISPSIF